MNRWQTCTAASWAEFVLGLWKSNLITLAKPLPHGDARDGQVLAVHDTWSNSHLQALVKAHARLQEYKCAERQSQDPAPVAPAAAQAPQANTPLLIPPLNHQLCWMQPGPTGKTLKMLRTRLQARRAGCSCRCGAMFLTMGWRVLRFLVSVKRSYPHSTIITRTDRRV